MAKYNITHACGHDETHQIAGPQNLRQGKADWFAEQDCRECWQAAKQAERKAANEQAQADNAAAGLPTLTGSEKQIAWAESIRAEILAGVDDMRKQIAAVPHPEWNRSGQRELAEKALEAVIAETSAGWWIDNKSGTLRTLMSDVARAIIKS